MNSYAVTLLQKSGISISHRLRAVMWNKWHGKADKKTGENVWKSIGILYSWGKPQWELPINMVSVKNTPDLITV